MTGGLTPETTPKTDEPTTGQKVAAEALGTFVLVLVGVSALLFSTGDVVATGLAFGFAMLVLVAVLGRVSGGHFNPAITLGAALGGRLAWRSTPVYLGAQLLGAILAGGCLFGLMHGFPNFAPGDAIGPNAFGDLSPNGYAWWAALLLELVLTFVLVTVSLSATDARNSAQAALAPVAIGLTLAMIHFASMPATYTSVNPARSIGTALFSGTDAMAQLWVFVLAPLLGGALAGLVYPLVFGQGAPAVAGSGLSFSARPKPQADGYAQPAPGGAWPAQPPQGQPAPGQWGAPQPGQWGAPDQWGQAAPTQTRQPYQDAGYAQPQYQQQPPAQHPSPQQHPGQQGPGQQAPAQGGQWGAPAPQQGWGAPSSDEEDGRTQIRPGG